MGRPTTTPPCIWPGQEDCKGEGNDEDAYQIWFRKMKRKFSPNKEAKGSLPKAKKKDVEA